jgi:CubicO group peptidase (beta-lactamase class C family)
MAENLSRLNRVPLSFPPGAAWRYSLATDVLGAVLAAASGMALPKVVERYVTGSLGMRDTGFTSEAARLATPYADPLRPGGDLRRMPDPFASTVPDGGTVRFSPGRIFDEAAYASGGVGMIGTASDYMLFLEAIRNGGRGLLSGSLAAAFVADAIPTLDLEPSDPGWGFGFGVAVLRDPSSAATPMRAGSWQWCGLYGTSFWVDPLMGLSVVALTNTAFEGMNGAFTRDLVSATYAQVGD